MLHRDPRNFSKENAFWILEIAAEVSFEQGLINRQVISETIRVASESFRKVERLGLRREQQPDALLHRTMSL